MTHFLCVSALRGEGGAQAGNHRAVETEITITLEMHFLSSYWSLGHNAAL